MDFFSVPFKVAQGVTLRWFKVRINRRILGTDRLRSKMNLKFNDKCDFCNTESEPSRNFF